MPVWAFFKNASISAYLPCLGQPGHERQIAACGKRAGHPTGLVADYQAGAVFVHIIHAIGHEIDDFTIDDVHFAMEFKAEDIVADVYQGCGFYRI